jgi:hypothetical protein
MHVSFSLFFRHVPARRTRSRAKDNGKNPYAAHRFTRRRSQDMRGGRAQPLTYVTGCRVLVCCYEHLLISRHTSFACRRQASEVIFGCQIRRAGHRR